MAFDLLDRFSVEISSNRFVHYSGVGFDDLSKRENFGRQNVFEKLPLSWFGVSFVRSFRPLIRVHGSTSNAVVKKPDGFYPRSRTNPDRAGARSWTISKMHAAQTITITI